MLLMKEPEAGPPPPEAAAEAAHGTAVVVKAWRGQLLTITDVAGGRAAQLFAFTAADLSEFLSPHHTRVFSNSYRLTLGMRLVTNRRRPVMVLGRDGVRAHDLLMPAATAATLARAGMPDEAGCRETVAAALAAAGLSPPKLPDPVNLFLNVAVRTDGALVPSPSISSPGASVTFRVLIDGQVAVAACATDLGISDGRGPIAVRVHNEL